MALNFKWLIPASLALAGFTSLPQLNESQKVDASKVIENVRCALQNATVHSRFLREDTGWTATVDLLMENVEDATIAANGGLNTNNFSTGGLISANATLAHQGTADRIVKVQFNMGLSSKTQACNRVTGQGQSIAGDLGIASWVAVIDEAVAEQRKTDRDFSPTAIGTTVIFTVKNSGQVNAYFSLVPLSPVNFNLIPNTAVSKSTQNQMVLSI